MRDDFSQRTRRILAARAGHRCSVCLKLTSGPADVADAALSDGIAAHITAASPEGPRFDRSMRAEGRRGAENGIWVCTQHGREIDSDLRPFTVAVLRGLKRAQEEYAAKKFQDRAIPRDTSARLIELGHVDSIYKLFEVVTPQTYTFATTFAMRDLLRGSENPVRLLNLGAQLIEGVWDSHRHVAGILSTILSNNLDYWQPQMPTLAKLKQLCASAIADGDWSRVAVIEPLAFALAGKEYRDIHQQILERLVSSSNWRKADTSRIREYYGDSGVELAAIIRHWKDPFRTGLLRANDVGRLIDLVVSKEVVLASPVRESILDLLVEHATVLSDSGAPELARAVADLVVGMSTPSCSKPAMGPPLSDPEDGQRPDGLYSVANG